MHVPLYLLTVAHLVCAAAAPRVSLERQVLREDRDRGRSGRRTCRLYCRVGIGFHLQIHPDGRVNGSHEPDQLSVLELFAVSQGVIGIKGVHGNRFLAMNRRGRLYATDRFSDDCRFRERFQENSYNTYASVVHRNHRTGRDWFVALNKRGKAKMGSSPRVKPQHVATHFLPRLIRQDDGERGFTITGRSKERWKTPNPKPPVVKLPAPKPPVLKPLLPKPPVVKPPVAKPQMVKPQVPKHPVPPVAKHPVVKPLVVKPPVSKHPVPPVTKPPVVKPPVPLVVKAVHAGTGPRRTPVKYWPKYRFG